MKTIIEMAHEANVLIFDRLNLITSDIDGLKRFADLVLEQGRQEGMKQERALWTLTKLGQNIEAQPWQGLTKGEINSALSKYQNWYDFAAHLENILKEKNQ